jgi:hypothetical protein
MEDVIRNAVENPKLPGSYTLPYTYTIYALQSRRNLNKFDHRYLIKNVKKMDSFDKRKFLQYN